MITEVETYPDRIRAAVRAWPQWSPAERRRMAEVEEDVLIYLRTGRGNAFIAQWCARVLPA